MDVVHLVATGGTPGNGQHGSMSRHEMHNILFAKGPSFKRGVALESPSGNVDIAPTILRLLGLQTSVPMDGRPLEEALEGGVDHTTQAWSTDVHNAEREVEGGVYRQQVSVSRSGETLYIDEGRAWLDS